MSLIYLWCVAIKTYLNMSRTCNVFLKHHGVEAGMLSPPSLPVVSGTQLW